jgi:hypothetical protein
MLVLPAESCCDVCLEEYNEPEMRLPHTMPCGPSAHPPARTGPGLRRTRRPHHLHRLRARPPAGRGRRGRGRESVPVLPRPVHDAGRARRAHRLSARRGSGRAGCGPRRAARSASARGAERARAGAGRRGRERGWTRGAAAGSAAGRGRGARGRVRHVLRGDPGHPLRESARACSCDLCARAEAARKTDVHGLPGVRLLLAVLLHLVRPARPPARPARPAWVCSRCAVGPWAGITTGTPSTSSGSITMCALPRRGRPARDCGAEH